MSNTLINPEKKFLDCTIRDGGYINKWNFSDECVKSIIETLDYIGYQYVEVGFRNKPEIYGGKVCGKWRYCTEQDLKTVVPPESSRNIKIAVMADYANSSIDLFDRVENTVIDMVRVAFHISDIDDALKFCKQLKNLGYIVCANAMATMNYNDEQIEKICNLSKECGIDYLYIADSYGCLINDDVTKIAKKMGAYLNGSSVKLGLHAHNNIQNGFSNFLQLQSSELIDIFDSTVLGMGRGAGNLCTELVIHSYPRFNDEHLKRVLLYAQDHILPLQSNGAIVKWGYTLPYIISAHFKCHPNYISKLQDYDITNVDKIWNYIEKIYHNHKNTLFDIQYLNKIVTHDDNGN